MLSKRITAACMLVFFGLWLVPAISMAGADRFTQKKYTWTLKLSDGTVCGTLEYTTAKKPVETTAHWIAYHATTETNHTHIDQTDVTHITEDLEVEECP